MLHLGVPAQAMARLTELVGLSGARSAANCTPGSLRMPIRVPEG